MDTSTADALAGFALLVTIGSFVLGLVVLIVFFVMASNIGFITRTARNLDHRQAGMQSSLDKVMKLMEKEAKEKV
jgi:ABC-type tungstate transport system substrate-binding protein